MEGLLPELPAVDVLLPARDPAALAPLPGPALTEEAEEGAGEDPVAPEPKGLLMGLLRTRSRGEALVVTSDGLEDALADPGEGLAGPVLFVVAGFDEEMPPLPAEAADEGVDDGLLRLALLRRLLETDVPALEVAVELAAPGVLLLFVAGGKFILIPSKALLMCAFRSSRSLRPSLM